MPQGKLKVKAKLPLGAKSKGIAKKRDAHFQKKNRPALPKKSSSSLRDTITKSINEHIETSAKERANLDGVKLKVVPKNEMQAGKSSTTKSS